MFDENKKSSVGESQHERIVVNKCCNSIVLDDATHEASQAVAWPRNEGVLTIH